MAPKVDAMSRAYLKIPNRFWQLPPEEYAALLDRLASHTAIKDAFAHFGSERVSDGYHVRMALRLVDPSLLADYRARLAIDLLPLAPIRPPNTTIVPRGCSITPIPDLSRWNGKTAFWNRLDTNQETGCWERRNAKGKHPRIRIFGKLYSPHRVAYTLKHGPIPIGRGYHGNVILHSCDNPPCCNPDHLKLGTQADNVADMLAKGRAA